MSAAKEGRYLHIDEAARYMGVSANTLRRANGDIESGTIMVPPFVSRLRPH